MKKTCLALAFSAALLSTTAFTADKVLATVNGTAVSESKVDFLIQQLASRGQKDSPELRAKIKEDLIRNEIVVQKAEEQGLGKSPEVATQLEMAKSQILFNAFITDYLKGHPVSEIDMKQFYDTQVKSHFSGKEYHARHILVATEKEAKAILSDLKKGKKFEELAKAKSTDKGSGANGGDLGWSSPANYVKEFAEALQKLPKGKISDTPVKSQFGFHIIKMEDLRDAKGPTYEDVKGEIQQELQNQALIKLIGEMRAKAKVE